MIKLLFDKPDYFVIARDAPHKTIRHVQYEDYKAGRPPAPDDFKRQVWHTKELLGQLHLPSLESPWYEADDLIGTVVNQYKSIDGIQISIITGDKDMKQLITDNVICYDAMYDRATTYQSFVRECEYQPTSIVDYLSLVGDSSDNISWVPGIGKVNAEKLIKQYHTIENIYEHIKDIGWSNQQKLLDGKESAFHSKGLIQLMKVPLMDHIPLEEYKREPNFNLIQNRLLHDWQFESLYLSIEKLKKVYTMPTQQGLF